MRGLDDDDARRRQGGEINQMTVTNEANSVDF